MPVVPAGQLIEAGATGVQNLVEDSMQKLQKWIPTTVYMQHVLFVQCSMQHVVKAPCSETMLPLNTECGNY